MYQILIQRYNQNHVQSGPDGGQFTSGGSSGFDVSQLDQSGYTATSIVEASNRGVYNFKVTTDKYGYTVLTVIAKTPDNWKTTAKGDRYDPNLAEENQYGNVVMKNKDWDTPAKAEDGIIWRGMSNEEYSSSIDKGVFESKGDYNIGDEQKGLTYYGTDPEIARSYANGFAPWQYAGTPFRSPAIVGIHDPGNHVKVEGTGSNEVGIRGPVSTSQQVYVLHGVGVSVSPGTFELREGPKGYTIGSSSTPSSRFEWKTGEPPKATHKSIKYIISAKYNQNHVQSGPDGGQFTSVSSVVVTSTYEKEFGDEDAAFSAGQHVNNVMFGLTGAYIGSLEGDAAAAAELYVDNGYMAMNTYLRHGPEAAMQKIWVMPNGSQRLPAVEKAIADLSSAISTAPAVPDDITLYRAFHSASVASNVDIVGSTVTDPGFLSTSGSPEVMNHFAYRQRERAHETVLMRIHSDGSARGLYAGNGENEVLFNKGTSVRITGRTVLNKGYVVLDAKIVH